MFLTSYDALVMCLGIVHKINRLSELTGISKATLEKIAQGSGYSGCLSTKLRLEAFYLANQNRVGRPFSKPKTKSTKEV